MRRNEIANDLDNKYMELCSQYKNMLSPEYLQQTNYLKKSIDEEDTNDNVENDNVENDNNICEKSFKTIHSTIKKYMNKKDVQLKTIDEIEQCIKVLETHVSNINNLKSTLSAVNNMNFKTYNITTFPNNEIMKQYNDIFSNDELHKIYNTINELNNIKELHFENIKNFSNIISNYKNLLKTNLEDDQELLNKYLNKNICSICYDKEITTCCDPCGHTYCTDCVKKITIKCYICNKTCKNKIKLFIVDTTNTNNTNNTSSLNTNNGLGAYSSAYYAPVNINIINDNEYNQELYDINEGLNNINNPANNETIDIRRQTSNNVNTVGNMLRNSNLSLSFGI